MKTDGQTECLAFLKGKILDFSYNYFGQLKEEEWNSDRFCFAEKLMVGENMEGIIRRSISIKDLNKIRNLKTWAEAIRKYSVQCVLQHLWNDPQTKPHIRKIMMDLESTIRKRLQEESMGQDIFSERFRELCGLFQLSEIEADVLLICHCLHNHLIDTPRDEKGGGVYKIQEIARWMGKPSSHISRVFATDQKLKRYQLLDSNLEYNDNLDRYLYGLSDEALEHKFYAQLKGDVLPWNYFGELAEKHGAMLKDLIRHRSPKRGVHILLYGAPGSGKTCFAQSLAAELGINCYGIAQDVKNDNTARTCSTPDFRFGALRLCDERVERAASLLIVDEADEMLRGSCGGGGMFAMLGGETITAGDKGLLNSLLDEVKTPCIWISNTPARMLDPSSRRRFDYSIRFDKLTAAQRRAIWKNSVGKYKLGRLFPRAMQEKLAERYDVSAGGITMVLKNIADLKPKAAECEALADRLMKQHCELLDIPTDRSKLLPETDYSLEGLNIRGDVPLERMVEAIRRFRVESADTATQGIDRPRMNLLLSGPPGTGKTEFVKYLGAALKTKVVVRMGSDILSMWVGGTEQNIKRAFDEAEAETSILFFDEIDGLLQDRGMAQHSWEMTQVNELLHRMENFNGVMIGATNFTDTLDPAVARRFTFKLEFRYLDETGKRLFFERMFRSTLSPAESKRLMGIPDLAPGDFRTVRQGLYYLGKVIANEDRLAALERESQAKGHNRHTTKKIGF